MSNEMNLIPEGSNDLNKIEIKTTVSVLDEVPEHMKNATPIIKEGEVVDELIEGLGELQETIEETLDVEKLLEKDESLREEEKDIVRKVLHTEDGGFQIDYKQLQDEAMKLALTEVFEKQEDMQKLIPYLFTTNKEEIKINVPEYDLSLNGVEYYLKDEFKTLYDSALGDVLYELYIVDAQKVHIALEGKTFEKDGKDIKMDIIYDFFGIMKNIEDLVVQRYNEKISEEAYVTAVDRVFPYDIPLVQNIFKDLNTKKDKGYLPRFKKLFYDTMIKNKKKAPIGLQQGFAELIDDLGSLMTLSYERVVLDIDKDFYEHVDDINKGEFVNGKEWKDSMTYAIGKALRAAYLNKGLRWTITNIEKQIYSTSLDKCYLFKKCLWMCEILDKLVKGEPLKELTEEEVKEYTGLKIDNAEIIEEIE